MLLYLDQFLSCLSDYIYLIKEIQIVQERIFKCQIFVEIIPLRMK